jgi:hypothetical protein
VEFEVTPGSSPSDPDTHIPALVGCVEQLRIE